ncbi:MAG: hypothetical protein U0105_06425 [Candidatus Obscuribacterales bacterium]
MNQRGVVEAVLEDSGKERVVAVRAGNLRIKVSLSDLILDSNQASALLHKACTTAAQRQAEKDRAREEQAGGSVCPPAAGNTLDLRGQRVGDEAMGKLERFVDSGILHRALHTFDDHSRTWNRRHQIGCASLS